MTQPFYITEAIEEGRITNPFILERPERKTIVSKGIVIQVLYEGTDDRIGKLVNRWPHD